MTLSAIISLSSHVFASVRMSLAAFLFQSFYQSEVTGLFFRMPQKRVLGMRWDSKLCAQRAVPRQSKGCVAQLPLLCCQGLSFGSANVGDK